MTCQSRFGDTPVGGRGSLRQLLLAAALTASGALAETASGQYDWSAHLGPRPTGFEQSRFGRWDLEVVSIRGMIDRAYYESAPLASGRVRKVSEVTRAVGPDSSKGQTFRRSTTYADRQGRITRIEYGDPLTGKVIQRETFTYDDGGRLVEWRRARPPSEVFVASIASTLYPDRAPYGMAQKFAYDDGGQLKEWRACAIVADQHLEKCDEDFVRFDGSGRIVGFGWPRSSFEIRRDLDGNAVTIVESDVASSSEQELFVEWGNGSLEERFVSGDDDSPANRAWFDDSGRMVQYRVVSASDADFYWTATWSHDSRGLPTRIQKGLDVYNLEYDTAGRLTSIEQSLEPKKIRRSFDASGRLILQEPPLFYRRLDPTSTGSERYTYSSTNMVERIEVRDATGRPVAETHFQYHGRR